MFSISAVKENFIERSFLFYLRYNSLNSSLISSWFS